MFKKVDNGMSQINAKTKSFVVIVSRIIHV